ncbi:hypothetical protein ACFPTO_16855 [Paraburkholderia denitrificans]|uniref:Uncharacterized protein n=1 Tax=Paraburkholderia denitrificans TaxID=694025 RepID=A0ABW0JBL5_9BURK
MSTNRTNLVGALLAVGALGATAGMMAWRWSQRHRAQRMSYHRELSRWEGEGGALDADGGSAVGASASSAGMSGLSGARASGAAASGQSNGAAGAPWPFPHGNA